MWSYQSGTRKNITTSCSISHKLIRSTATDSIWRIATQTRHTVSRLELAEDRVGVGEGSEAASSISAKGHSLPVGWSYCAQFKYN